MSESLAVKYRPRRFADLVGQKHVAAVLGAAAKRHEPPQQILFFGGSGIGKTTVARIFAAALNCLAPTERGDACGVCTECVSVADGSHPDVIEFDAASHGGKDEIKEIAARTAFAPMRSKWKVYIIDESHALSGPGSQAFLKTLEEPAPHVVFALCTTNPEKMIGTIRGRCLQQELLTPTQGEMARNLQRIATSEGWALPDDVAELCVEATEPALGLRGTVMTLGRLATVLKQGESVDVTEAAALLGVVSPTLFSDLTSAVLDSDRPRALLALESLREQVGDPQIRRGLSAWARRTLLEACRDGDAEAVAAWRYEKIVSAPEGSGWLDVTVAALAQPSLDPSPEALQALLSEAEKRIEDLTRTLVEARTLPAQRPSQDQSAPETVAAPAPAGPVPSETSPGAPDTGAVREDRGVGEVVEEGQRAPEREVPQRRRPARGEERTGAPAPQEAEQEGTTPRRPAPAEKVETGPAPRRGAAEGAPVPERPTRRAQTTRTAPPVTPHIVPDGVDLGWGDEPLPVDESDGLDAEMVGPGPRERFLDVLATVNPHLAEFLQVKCETLEENGNVIFVIPAESVEKLKAAKIGPVVQQASRDADVPVKLRPGR